MTGRFGRMAGPALALAMALGVLAGCQQGGEHPTGAAPGEAAKAGSGPGCKAGQAPALDGVAEEIVVDGETRRYLVDVPASPGDKPLPVVLAFHGFASDAAEFRSSLPLKGMSDRDGFLVAYPEGREGVQVGKKTGRGFDMMPTDTRDAAFVRALLDRLARDHCIDEHRVYATGFSNGGFLANLLGCVLADRLAAVAPVAGAVELPGCTPARPMPILFINGVTDARVGPHVIETARNWWAKANDCGPLGRQDEECLAYKDCKAPVVQCLGPQAHTWPSHATEEIWAFFQANPRR